MSDLTADYYKQHHGGSTGFRRYGFSVKLTERVGWFGPRIGAGVRLLDLGCRDGELTSHFLQGNQVVGVDVDDDALERAKSTYGFEVANVNLNTSHLPFDDGAFDCVLAGEVLEHLQFPEVAVREIHRVLAPDGAFLGSVPNAFRLPNRIRFLLGKDFETDPTHLHHFSPDSLRALLIPFRDVEIDYIVARGYRRLARLMGSSILFSCRK